jgi:hypothetical protein
VRARHRREGVGEPRRHALPPLAVVAPAWWRAVRHPDRRARDTRRAAEERLPTTQAARALTIGPDGGRWRAAIEDAAAP